MCGLNIARRACCSRRCRKDFEIHSSPPSPISPTCPPPSTTSTTYPPPSPTFVSHHPNTTCHHPTHFHPPLPPQSRVGADEEHHDHEAAVVRGIQVGIRQAAGDDQRGSARALSGARAGALPDAARDRQDARHAIRRFAARRRPDARRVAAGAAKGAGARAGGRGQNRSHARLANRHSKIQKRIRYSGGYSL